jgi:HEAT repeat protein
VIYIGPVGPIPVGYDDDPRFEQERQAWSKAIAIAQALVTPDELIAGMSHPDWRVRHQVVARLVARAGDDERTIPLLVNIVTTDSSPVVRDAAVMAMKWPDDARVLSALRAAENDPDEEVRSSASYMLGQLD